MKKQETLEEAIKRLYPDNIIKLGNETSYNSALIKRKDFIEGAKWQKEQDKNKYSKEEVSRIITSCKEYLSFGDEFNEKEWFEQFKKK